MKRLLVILTLCLLPLCADARLRFHGGQPASGGGNVSCPYAGTASTDGCSGAVAGLSGASVQHSNFFTGYGNQEGQTYWESSFTGSIVAGNGYITISGCGSTCIIDHSGASINETLNCTNGSGTVGACSTSGTLPAGVFITQIGGSGCGGSCTGTGGNGTYQISNASTVNASGTMQALMRPPWNVAGVEYPVGVPATVTLLDPGTAMSTCPTVGTHNSVSDFACKDANGHKVVYISGTNPTIQGWDFTQEGGWLLYITAGNSDIFQSTNLTSNGLRSGFVNASGALTVQNNKWQGGGASFNVGGDLANLCGPFSNNNGPGGCGIWIEDPLASLTSETFTNNYGDWGASEGSNSNVTTMLNGEICGDIGTSPKNGPIGNTLGSNVNPIFKYNVVLNVNNRCNAAYGMEWDFNYFENANYNSVAHGEMTAESTGTTSSPPTITSSTYTYNTVLEPTRAAGGLSALFWLTNGGAMANITTVTTSNNTLLTNAAAISVTANSSAGRTTCAGTPADTTNCQVTINTPPSWGLYTQSEPIQLASGLLSASSIAVVQAVPAASIASSIMTVSSNSGIALEPGDVIQCAAGFCETGNQWDTPSPASPIPHGVSLTSPFGGSGCGGTCTGSGGAGTYALTGASGLTVPSGGDFEAFLGGTPGNSTMRYSTSGGSSLPAAPFTMYAQTAPSSFIEAGGGGSSTITTWNCNSNFYDPLANANPTISISFLCQFGGATLTTFNHSGNTNMLTGGQF